MVAIYRTMGVRQALEDHRIPCTKEGIDFLADIFKELRTNQDDPGAVAFLSKRPVVASTKAVTGRWVTKNVGASPSC